MNVLLSPPARRSTGKNAENLKRPAEVTPVPSSTSVAKRSRHVTPKRIAKLASSQPVKPQPNFFQAVYDMLEQSTAMNPKLIRWTEDGTAFSHDDKNIVKLSQWLTTFGTYERINTGSACCRSFSSHRFSYSSFLSPGLPKWDSFRRRLNIYGWRRGSK